MARASASGVEITFYSFWYEFRYGLTTCLMLTIALITTIFYFHPSTTSVTAYFRTVPILPETNGRVAEVFVGFTGDVEKGAPIFRLDSTKQEAALEVATADRRGRRGDGDGEGRYRGRRRSDPAGEGRL